MPPSSLMRKRKPFDRLRAREGRASRQAPGAVADLPWRLPGLTDSTGQAASSSTAWAVLPVISFPTGLRRRSPMTTRSAATSAAASMIASAAEHRVVDCRTSWSTPASVSSARIASRSWPLAKLRVRVVPVASGVHHDDPAAGAPGQREGVLQRSRSLTGGQVADHDVHCDLLATSPGSAKRLLVVLDRLGPGHDRHRVLHAVRLGADHARRTLRGAGCGCGPRSRRRWACCG